MSGDKASLDKYIAFLSAGGSDYPIELLKKAGVDMTTSDPFDKTIASMNKVMDEIEKILDKKEKKWIAWFQRFDRNGATVKQGFFIYLCLPRDVSSVGSERLLHTQEVAGSNPARPTSGMKHLRSSKLQVFLFCKNLQFAEMRNLVETREHQHLVLTCLLYTSDAADE